MRDLREYLELVRDGQARPSELIDEALRAAAAAQPRLNLFTAILGEQAREQAHRLDTQAPLPMQGLPIVVKDLFDVAGAPTTGCSDAWTATTAAHDAAAVDTLVRAGAVVVAKANQHELGCGPTNAVSAAGPAINPWGENRMTGGSSGGSAAAVGAGVVPAALGTDAGGSVRIPAAFCGVTGLKPTHGAVSLRGAMPSAPSLDTVGPIARTAADCLALFRHLAGHDPADPVSTRSPGQTIERDLPGLRIGVPARFFTLVDRETRLAVEEAARTLERLGAQVLPLDGPDPDEGVAALVGMAVPEIAHAYRDLWGDARLHPHIGALMDMGQAMSAVDYVDALTLARKVRQDFARTLAEVDVLLTPCTPYPAPRLDAVSVPVEGGELDTLAAPARFTNPVSVALLPALAFPVGQSSDGMPLAAQLIGPGWSESLLCAVGDAYQQVTDWHRRSPGRA